MHAHKNIEPGACEFFAYVIESELECLIAGALATTAACGEPGEVPLGTVKPFGLQLYMRLSGLRC